MVIPIITLILIFTICVLTVTPYVFLCLIIWRNISISYISRFKVLINKAHKPILSLLLAALVTILIGVFVPKEIDLFNDNAFGKRTILSEPELVDALKTAQDKGVVMAVHGYHHEDFHTVNAETAARELVQKRVGVFEAVGLNPVAFYDPLIRASLPPVEVQEAVESVLPRRLPNIAAIDENGNEDDLLETDMIEEYYIQNVISS